ncbi:MAG: S-adenosylmethionine decarboxylase proenzyme precursor [Candidatus Methanolliviera sp. GoM_asphalt]|nr:MAG: S-adenosylmethionine decarboxylase proenzyme precursor [Candidatus Methanolliviera sp. GoM_asphalt]
MVRVQAIMGIIRDCDLEKMEDANFMQVMIERTVKLMDLTLLKTVSHKFTPQGLTTVALLSESHIAIDTYPEEKLMLVDVISCGQKDAKIVLDIMEDMLGGITEIIFDKMIEGN